MNEIRLRALFSDLEEVTRALIKGAAASGQMYALLDVASQAVDDGRYDEARSKLAELHYLAIHRDEQ